MKRIYYLLLILLSLACIVALFISLFMGNHDIPNIMIHVFIIALCVGVCYTGLLMLIKHKE